MGRWLVTGTGPCLAIAKVVVPCVNRLYFWHPDHCRDIYRQEEEALKSLYP